MLNENKVSGHYQNTHLLAAIINGLKQLGKTPDTVKLEDLTAIEEFHIGGRIASKNLLEQLNLSHKNHVLDIGCGIGGASRFVASHFKSTVTGIDLTSEYIETGRTLCSWFDLNNRINLHHGSALSMPFDDKTFDAAYMMHVGMNIEDKRQLFSEVNRLLCMGSLFGIYDVMQTGEGNLNFPVPWANSPEISSLASVEHYKETLKATGFEIISEHNRRQLALEFFSEQRTQRIDSKKPPALGLHLVMGDSISSKMNNVVKSISSGYLAPVELIVRKI